MSTPAHLYPSDAISITCQSYSLLLGLERRSTSAGVWPSSASDGLLTPSVAVMAGNRWHQPVWIARQAARGANETANPANEAEPLLPTETSESLVPSRRAKPHNHPPTSRPRLLRGGGPWILSPCKLPGRYRCGVIRPTSGPTVRLWMPEHRFQRFLRQGLPKAPVSANLAMTASTS